MNSTAQRPRARPSRAALAGALAVGVAIAEAQLLAALTGTASLVNGVGALVIAQQPPGAEALMVGLFGDADKVALWLLIVLVASALGAASGVLAARDWRLGVVAFAAGGAVAGLATARTPLADAGAAVVAAALAIGAGLVALRWLLGLAADATPDDHAVEASTSAWRRRRFLIASAGTLGGIVAASAISRLIPDDRTARAADDPRPLPRPVTPVADPDPGQALAVAGITPIVTPAGQLYRTDTELSVPQVDVERWRLEVTGMVDHPMSLTYDDLLAMPLFEQYATIACVSNEVGGHLVGTPLWTGVRLKDVLAEVGVQRGATQIMGRSWGDFSAGFPTEWAMAPGREPMIALGLDREVLPAVHGFPARLVVPGLYGYASATKWLTQIELTTLDAQDGFWVSLGWAKVGSVLTQSRIDVPANGALVAAGSVLVAGVAWAPDRGVRAVEVRFDGGAWQPARLSRPLSAAAWVQWSLGWIADPGQHSIEVRATDSTGAVQTDEITRPAPSGARGHHRIVVTMA